MRRSLAGVSRSWGSLASWSIAHRNAASVLPDPVGAEIRTCSPEAIAGQACSWAAVGCANAPSNQSLVRGLNARSGIAFVSLAGGCAGIGRTSGYSPTGPGRRKPRHEDGLRGAAQLLG